MMAYQYARPKVTETELPNFVWTSRNFDRAIDMHLDGKSAREIGEALGCTRNAVIGKLNRHRYEVDAVRENRCEDPPIVDEPPPKEEKVNPYEVFLVREKSDRSCAMPGCRNTKQYNRYNLCSKCDQDRINGALEDNPRIRANMRSVAD